LKSDGWRRVGALNLQHRTFTTAWSAKLEYEYFGLGSRSVAFTDQFANRVNVGIDQNIHTVKVGINYRFDWGAPVVAKY
jgi:outer membrane immunogenic protein